ncbi:hypothetical protein [Nocardioides nanhaiensis]|uniref:Uncharacterized protein n=1 Tax=Nocardioides nanhaiensis TaxID=1476871 RepID=A0ABP8W433_9ACTN
MENKTNTMTMPNAAPSPSTTPWHLSVSASGNTAVSTHATASVAACVRVRGMGGLTVGTTAPVGLGAAARIDAVDARQGAFAGIDAAGFDAQATVPGSRTWSPPPC